MLSVGRCALLRNATRTHIQGRCQTLLRYAAARRQQTSAKSSTVQQTAAEKQIHKRNSSAGVMFVSKVFCARQRSQFRESDEHVGTWGVDASMRCHSMRTAVILCPCMCRLHTVFHHTSTPWLPRHVPVAQTLVPRPPACSPPHPVPDAMTAHRYFQTQPRTMAVAALPELGMSTPFAM